MTGFLRRLGVFIGAAVVGMATWTSVCAQVMDQLPPVRSGYDENGVDMVYSLEARFEGPVLSIGQPGAGGLSFQQNYTEVGAYWGYWSNPYKITAVLYKSGGFPDKVTVVFDDRTELFDVATSQSNVPSEQDTGAFLTLAGSGGESEYISQDGRKLVFYMTSDTDGRLKYIQYPNGEKIFLTFDANSPSRVISINNNHGYQIKLEYNTSGVLTKATAINNAVEFCHPEAATCTLTQPWPSITYASSVSGNYTTYTATDSVGRVTTVVMDRGKITSIQTPEDSRSYTRKFYGSTTPPGEVTSVSTADTTWIYTGGTTTSYGYRRKTDSTGRMWEVGVNFNTFTRHHDTDPAGNTTYYSYSGGLLTGVTYPGGQSVAYTYSTDGRQNLLSTTFTPTSGTATVTSATYESSCTSSNILYCNKPKTTTAAHPVTQTTGLKVTDYTYHQYSGGVESVTLPSPDGGSVRPTMYTIYAQSVAQYYRDTDSDPNVTSVTISNDGPIWIPQRTQACVTGNSCSQADTATTVFKYGTDGGAQNLQLMKIVRGDFYILGDYSLGSVTDLNYDDVGNLITVDGPLSGDADTTRYRYDAARRVVGIIGPDPDASSSTIKARAVRKTYATSGSSPTPELVEEGTVTSVTGDLWDSNFTVLSKVKTYYDARSRPVKTMRLNAAGTTTLAVTQTSYSGYGLGQVECQAVRMNSADFASAMNPCDQGTGANDLITMNWFDTYGRLSSVTEGVGTSASRTERTLAYHTSGDGKGQLASVTDGGGHKTSYDYDAFGRKWKVSYPTTTGTGTSSTTDYELYGYDAAGNVTSFTPRGGSAITLSYDALDRPTTAVDGTTYTYDNLGRVLTLTRSSQTATYVYDKFGNLQSEATALGTVAYEYDKAGRRTKTIWPDSFYVTYDWNPASDLLAIRENGGSGTPLAAFEYDALGRRSKLTRGNGTSTTYTVDSDTSTLSSLTMALAGNNNYQVATFTRDLAGRITNRASTNSAFEAVGSTTSSTTTYGNNGLNQLETVTGAPNLGYDDRGNTTSQGGVTQTFDIANRMLTTQSGSVTLAYDAAGRLREYGGTSTTRFVYDGADLIAEYDTSGNVLRRYIHGPGADEPIVWMEGAGHSLYGTPDRRYLTADERGSIVAVTGSTGTVLAINMYDEYGAPSTTSTTYAGRFRYTGQAWLAEAGLYYYKARIYSPTLGRFLQADPIGYGDGLNMYAYVGNDPVNGIDPTGTDCIDIDTHMARSCADYVNRYTGNPCKDTGDECVLACSFNYSCNVYEDPSSGPSTEPIYSGLPGLPSSFKLTASCLVNPVAMKALRSLAFQAAAMDILDKSNKFIPDPVEYGVFADTSSSAISNPFTSFQKQQIAPSAFRGPRNEILGIPPGGYPHYVFLHDHLYNVSPSLLSRGVNSDETAADSMGVTIMSIDKNHYIDCYAGRYK